MENRSVSFELHGLFVGSGLILDTVENVLGDIHFFYDTQKKALLSFYIAAWAYEYINYNYFLEFF